MAHSERTRPPRNDATSHEPRAVSPQPPSAVRQKKLASPDQAEFALCEQTIFIAFEENGPQLSDGFADHITWHCWGTVEYSKGEGQGQGHCVGTDPSGDQIAMTVNDEKHKLDQKSWNGSWTYIGGSGKYTELTGGGKYVAHGNEFRTAAEGTYVGYNTFEGRYKLP